MQIDLVTVADELGPAKVLFVREPGVGMEGVVVVDNIACGPSIGGVRMAPDIDAVEVFRLARAMTLKNAAAGLPHGGGKAGIAADPTCSPERKQALVRAFARAIADLRDYIPGPDMGTNEQCMAWVHDEIGRAVGLPRVVGGIPLDDIGATGVGVAVAADACAELLGLELDGARVAVQGFGAVGIHAARCLAERGARLVAASDSHGAIENGHGLDVAALTAHKHAGRAVAEFEGGQVIERDAVVGVECDVWIPAARPDVITEANVAQLRASFILQGANIPITEGAERILHQRGVWSIPDFIANAGGVICAATEYAGGGQQQALDAIAEKIGGNTREVIERARRDDVLPREAAQTMARARVSEAMGYRRP